MFSEEIMMYVIIPLLIFISRILDVSLGTLRIILVSKGIKLSASIIGFFEVFIWINAMAKIMSNLSNIYCYVAYALGFSAGTYVGIILEDKLSIGRVRLRIMTKKDISEMIEKMKPTKFVFVSENVKSSDGQIQIINAFIDRKYLKRVLTKIKKEDPQAFYTVEDLKMVKETEGIHQKKFSVRFRERVNSRMMVLRKSK